MTKLLEEAIAEIRRLPDAEQDRAAELLLGLVTAREAENYRLTPEQRTEVESVVREMDEGTMMFVSEEEMAAIWARVER